MEEYIIQSCSNWSQYFSWWVMKRNIATGVVVDEAIQAWLRRSTNSWGILVNRSHRSNVGQQLSRGLQGCLQGCVERKNIIAVLAILFHLGWWYNSARKEMWCTKRLFTAHHQGPRSRFQDWPEDNFRQETNTSGNGSTNWPQNKTIDSHHLSMVWGLRWWEIAQKALQTVPCTYQVFWKTAEAWPWLTICRARMGRLGSI